VVCCAKKALPLRGHSHKMVFCYFLSFVMNDYRVTGIISATVGNCTAMAYRLHNFFCWYLCAAVLVLMRSICFLLVLMRTKTTGAVTERNNESFISNFLRFLLVLMRTIYFVGPVISFALSSPTHSSPD